MNNENKCLLKLLLCNSMKIFLELTEICLQNKHFNTNQYTSKFTIAFSVFESIMILQSKSYRDNSIPGIVFFWWYNSNVLPFTYQWRYWHGVFFPFSRNRGILFDMRYAMIRKMLRYHHSCQDVMIMKLAPKCREWTLFCQTLPLKNGHGVIHDYPRLQYDTLI